MVSEIEYENEIDENEHRQPESQSLGCSLDEPRPVNYQARMSGDTVAKIKQDIAKQRALMEAAKAEVARLESALEVVLKYELPHRDKGEGSENGKQSLSELVEIVLLSGGPMTAASVFEAIMEKGRSTTQNAISTNLSRMKQAGRIENEDGLWNVAAKGRKNFSK